MPLILLSRMIIHDESDKHEENVFMELKRLLSLVRQAAKEYELIEEGDKIAVGVSGGKDSLTLLYALAKLREFYPEKFEIEAVTVDVGFNMDFSRIEEFCRGLDVNYTIVKTEIKTIVFDERKESNPCSLCAKMRKGALINEIQKLGCNKVAYAHHKDDFVNTLMLSMIYEGRLQSLEAKFMLDGAGISVIRPLMLISEAEVIGFKNKYNLPVAKNLCPVDKHTKREYVDNLVKEINRENPGAKDRMFTAIINGLKIS